jgi:ABC-type uncharacterized transport system substrate-binding protein
VRNESSEKGRVSSVAWIEAKQKYMKKKITVLTLCAMLLALCYSASAQQPKKVPRIGYLSAYDSGSESSRAEGVRLALRELGYIEGQNEAHALGLTIQPWEIRAADDFERVFAALNKERPDGLYASAGLVITLNGKRIVDFALKSRLPSTYSDRESVTAGGLMYYGADIADSYRRVAYYVDRILKGAKPADLPVEQPTKFELVINLKTAKQIGLTIPQSMLYRADRVIK